MIRRTYTWSCTLKIASATNVTQPLASKKKKKQHYFMFMFQNFWKKIMHVPKDIQIYSQTTKQLYMILYSYQIYIYIYIYKMTNIYQKI